MVNNTTNGNIVREALQRNSSDEPSGSTSRYGHIPTADRLQRLVIGGCLMALSITGLIDHFEWKRILALILQAELLTTSLLGWCPFYWACRVRQGKPQSLATTPTCHRSD